MSSPLTTLLRRCPRPSSLPSMRPRPSQPDSLSSLSHPLRAISSPARSSPWTHRPCFSPAARPYSSASTTTRTPPSSSSSASSAAPSPSSALAPLDWNTFFKLRLRRRRIQLVFSVASSIVGGASGAVLLAEGFAEPLVAQIPLDPFVTLGLLTFACAGMGWLLGPTLGNQVFYLVNRRFKTQMMRKESEFFARVKKHRVDPSNSSAGNPVPDFYGEKIQSVAGYRRWLKDQRAFNKKKTASFV